MTTILNDEVVVLPQHETTVVSLQGTDIVYLEVDPAMR